LTASRVRVLAYFGGRETEKNPCPSGDHSRLDQEELFDLGVGRARSAALPDKLEQELKIPRSGISARSRSDDHPPRVSPHGWLRQHPPVRATNARGGIFPCHLCVFIIQQCKWIGRRITIIRFNICSLSRRYYNSSRRERACPRRFVCSAARPNLSSLHPAVTTPSTVTPINPRSRRASVLPLGLYLRDRTSAPGASYTRNSTFHVNFMQLLRVGASERRLVAGEVKAAPSDLSRNR